MPREPAVRLSVSWGYDVIVELRVSRRNWSKIAGGKPVTIRGNGYYYEGEFFRDYWDFSGGLENFGSDTDRRRTVTTEMATSAPYVRHWSTSSSAKPTEAPGREAQSCSGFPSDHPQFCIIMRPYGFVGLEHTIGTAWRN
jgi:hypothetical protein